LIQQESLCVPEAIVYHDRTLRRVRNIRRRGDAARKKQKRDVLRWSLLNQQLIFKKYWHCRT